MPYATKADLLRRMTLAELAQLTGDDNNGQVDDAKVTAVLTEVSATIDSYCRQRYAVPLQASEQIEGVALKLAVYELFSRRRRASDQMRTDYEDAIAFLKDVASGKAGLDQPAGATEQSPASSVGVAKSEKEQRFSDCNLKGYV